MHAALAYPEINPIAIQLGPVAIRWYSLAYIAGIVLGWRYVLRLAGRGEVEGVTRLMIDDFVLWATLGVILGGRLGYVLFYKPDFFFAHPAEIPAMWRGGMSFHGGLLGVVTAIVLFAWKRGVSILSFGDLICAATPIGLFFGRIANFINGELYGRFTDVWWAMIFPRGAVPASQVPSKYLALCQPVLLASGPGLNCPRHPSQLYEATLEGLVLFALLWVLVHRFGALKRPGLIAGTFLAGYGVCRFLVEFVREPDAFLGTVFAGFTMGQLLSMPLIVAGIGLAWYAARRR